MTLTYHAFWMLCGLGAAIFATEVVAGQRQIVNAVTIILGFVGAAFWIGTGHSIDAASIGTLVAAIAAWHLFRPGAGVHHSVLGRVFGSVFVDVAADLIVLAGAGVLAAIWASLLEAQGIARSLGLTASAALLLVSTVGSLRMPSFAPPIVREEAILGVGALALIVAVAPTVSQGWQSALALNLGEKSGALPLVPMWMVGCIGVSMTVGGLWSLWRRG